MRLTDYDKLQLKLREYADRKATNGEIELANGILKAKCFIDQECEVFDEQQLNNGWIPVSERLPEIRQLYDVSLRYENFSGIYEITRMADYIGDGEWNIYGPQPVIATRHIMAWKNRTEPYKGVSE